MARWRKTNMGAKMKLGITILLIAACAALQGCVPIAVGAAGAVAADKVVENRNGGEGLF
jgi:hypothetical protein